MGKRLVLFAVLFAGALVVGLFSKAWYVRDSSASAPPIGLRASGRPSESPVHRVPAEPEAVAPSEARPRTKREILAEYWGTEWAALEGMIEERVTDLDSHATAGLPRPWEEVEAQAAQAVLGNREEVLRFLYASFPIELTEADLSGKLNPERKELTPDQLAELHALADTFEAELKDAVQGALQAELAYRRRVWEEGLYAAGPFCPIPGSEPSQRIHEMGPGTMVSFGGGGWEVSFRVDPRGDLDYERSLAKAQGVVDARAEALRLQMAHY